MEKSMTIRDSPGTDPGQAASGEKGKNLARTRESPNGKVDKFGGSKLPISRSVQLKPREEGRDC